MPGSNVALCEPGIIMQFSETLANRGLNLQAVLSLDGLPDSILKELQCTADLSRYRQLLLLGHGGKKLWQQIKNDGFTSNNTVDDFTCRSIQAWFKSEYDGTAFKILYPGEHLIPLQLLGQIAGWHFPSPFMVGVNDRWGSWYAYRAVVLADSQFAVTLRPEWHSPCETCNTKPCISACPVSAVSDSGLDLARCIAYRKQPDSACRFNCLARWTCPVATLERYSEEQLHYHYERSLQTLLAIE